ncbi:hypothetical protein JXA88_12015 [Candidatus Fermentibacteria bacterium]|nr:hypothetical protein [Candidatus Fermentibacteria bacterium]
MVTTGCGGSGPAVLEMVKIRGGSFLMGSNAGDPDEQPVHEVHIMDE